ncbi:MAG TPA: hypothetical protein VFA70_01550 [Dehalococcoidia bacterium]|jgi:hypothetical protein|nr:hypothetical protein [Dehalococcoidia bacterium]
MPRSRTTDTGGTRRQQAQQPAPVQTPSRAKPGPHLKGQKRPSVNEPQYDEVDEASAESFPASDPPPPQSRID